MAGMKVIPVNCDKKGNIDLKDLCEKAAKYSNELAAIMITYPSTHGVFETTVKKYARSFMITAVRFISMAQT